MCMYPNSIDDKYVKQNLIEMKGEVHKLTTIVGNSKVPFCTIDRTITQKTRKDIKQVETSATNRS